MTAEIINFNDWKKRKYEGDPAYRGYALKVMDLTNYSRQINDVPSITVTVEVPEVDG